MSLTERDKLVLKNIRNWEKELHNYEIKDFEQSYDKWLENAFGKLPQNLQERFLSSIDHWLFQLHDLLQGFQSQNDAKQRILLAAKLQYPYIQSIKDLKTLPIDKLIYLAEQEISKHRLYSFAQGGLTGSGGFFFMAADIPLMIAVNLRSVQLISLIYGYEVNTPFEMVTSLKVFYAATLPKRLQGNEWEGLFSHLDNGDDSYFWYEGNMKLTDSTWMDFPLKQLVKSLFILFLKRKMFQGIPILGMGIGAGLNYQLTRQVTDFAHHFYQLRYLQEKGE